jgi:putative nucleotidyltransferase with HDIG domain
MRTASTLSPDVLRNDFYIRSISGLTAQVGPIYLVGGYLRDRLLKRDPTRRIDLDLVVWGEPESFGRAVAGALGATLIPLDRESARALVRRDGTLVRIDISRPKGETIEADLAARDFTVNALAVRLDTGLRGPAVAIIDPFGGLDDLMRRRLRALAPSAFDQDPLRLMRAVRLAGEIDFTIEEATRLAIVERASLLAIPAGERVREELFRIIELVPAAPAIETLDALQLLRVLVPEAEALKAVPASLPHRLPLWEHSLETLRSVELLLSGLGQSFPDDHVWLHGRLEREIEGGITEVAVLKLVGLLHDLGKPETRTVQPDGRVRFLGHEEAGLRILMRLCERLHLGRHATGLVVDIERHHLRPLGLSREATVTPRAMYRLFRELGDAAPAVLLHSWADLRATIGAEVEEFSRHQTLLRELFRFYRTEFRASQMTPFVRGDDLISVFGLAPGPFLGVVLDRVREAQAMRLINSPEETLDYVRQSLEAWRRAYEASRAAGPTWRGEND